MVNEVQQQLGMRKSHNDKRGRAPFMLAVAKKPQENCTKMEEVLLMSSCALQWLPGDIILCSGVSPSFLTCLGPTNG